MTCDVGLAWWLFGVLRPLAAPVTLTLALSRRAGEGIYSPFPAPHHPWVPAFAGMTC